MCQVVSILNERGEVVGHAWHCICNRLPNGELEPMDERWARNTAQEQMREIEAEEVRRKTALHDPERRLRRNVRHELGDRSTVNLGMRANRIVDGKSRRFR